MGVNMAGNCIVDDEACRYASNMEIIRRYYKCLCDQKRTGVNSQEIYKIELLMNQAGITPSSRPVVNAALEKSAKAVTNKRLQLSWKMELLLPEKQVIC